MMNYLKIVLAFCAFVTAISYGDLLAQIAVKGETVYTMNGDPVSNGVVLIQNGKIERVGTDNRISIPNGYEIYEAKVVTPGLIDARSVVGLSGILNQEHDQDQLELSNAFQPDLRAIDAYNAREDLVKFLLDKGITAVHTGHGPGAVVSGQTMIAKTAGKTLEQSLVDSVTAISITLGAGIHNEYSSPGTRAKAVAILRQHLINGQQYAEKRRSDNPPDRDLNKEVIADLIDGKIYAMIHVQRANDIMTALRLQKEFGFRMLLEGAAEAYLVKVEIREAGIPVLIHPTMVRTSGGTQNASFETAGHLAEAGIPVLFQSGFESYVPKTRVVLYEAAIAVANGMDYNDALKALTIDAATILGIENRVGTLENDKDADLVLFDGDPFEYTTKAAVVIVNGQVMKGEQ
ncbi:MAG: amidohydrolase family protein [Balneolaceae bacterium]